MRVLIAAFLLVVVGCTQQAAYLEAEEDVSPAYLSIANEYSGGSVRCLFSLAHFITYDAPVISDGESIDVELQRGNTSGTLYLRQNGSPLMAVENVFCGIDHAWTKTKIDLTLTPLRREARKRLNVHCNYNGALICAAKGVE